jgi:20S proteasome alpha/beta subunit
VTVCVAALFNFLYQDGVGKVAVVMSDRKITTGDVEYEPNQQKIAYITNRAIITIAGDYSIHSEALRLTTEQLKDRPEAVPQAIASIYGQAIQAVKRKQAEDIYLSPLGLNIDTFLAQQSEYSNSFTEKLTQQLQNFRGDEVEALVIASDGTNSHIIHIDSRGVANNMDDVGFAAIGIGSWHARSKLMQLGYVNNGNYGKAVTDVFTAKRAAEIAPGVGKLFTDTALVFKSGVEQIRADVYQKLEEIYAINSSRHQNIDQEAVDLLNKYIGTLSPPPEGPLPP